MDFAGMLAHERRKKAEERRRAAEAAAIAEAAEHKAERQESDASTAAPPPVGGDEAAARPAHRTPLVELHGGPTSMWYCQDFLSDAEAASLEESIRTEHPQGEWITLTKRRLLNLGGVPHPDGMLGESLPEWLQPVIDRLTDSGAFPDGPPNQCLLNEYDVGQGIDPHCDGPLYEPRAAVLSLCSSALLRFLDPAEGRPSEDPDAATGGGRSWASRSRASVLMRPGSLVVFTGEAYESLLHGVLDAEAELVEGHTLNRDLASAAEGEWIPRGARLSLTLRRVRQVAVPAGEFLQPAQQAEAARRRAWWARAISEKR